MREAGPARDGDVPAGGADAGEGGYSLILLDVGRDEVVRIVRAAIRVRGCDADEAIGVLRAPLPIRVASGLTHGAAQEGQHEFISCDCVSIFVRDEIVEQGGFGYLADLFRTVGRSEEFGFVSIELESIPDTGPGRRFADQFLGYEPATMPLRLEVREKKARLMEYFGERMGVVLHRAPASDA